jgi:hypothetical protein
VQNNEFKKHFPPSSILGLIIHKTKFTQSPKHDCIKNAYVRPQLPSPQAFCQIIYKESSEKPTVITEEILSQVKPVDSSSEKTVDISSEKIYWRWSGFAQ